MVRFAFTSAALAAVSLAPATVQTLANQVAVESRKLPKAPVPSVPQTLEKVELRDIPLSMVRIDRRFVLWAVTDTPMPVNTGGIQPEPDGLYLLGIGHLTDGGGCSRYDFVATLDLTTIRAHGFRLVDTQVIPTSPPAGFSRDMEPDDARYPVRPSETGPKRDYKKVSFLQPAYGKSYGRLHECRAVIHARIWVIGPKGIDPITGKTIPPRRAPN